MLPNKQPFVMDRLGKVFMSGREGSCIYRCIVVHLRFASKSLGEKQEIPERGGRLKLGGGEKSVFER